MTVKIKRNIIKSIVLFFALIISLFIFIYFKSFAVIINDIYGEYNLWDGITVSTNFDGGDGSIDNPYQINSGSTLMYLKSLLEGEEYLNYNNLYYIITSNINLDNHQITPIGDNVHVFSGHLNGNGYSLANININSKYVSNNYYSGLFAYLLNAEIKNINLKNIEYNFENSNPYEEKYVGSIAAISDNSIINNIGIYTLNVNTDGKIGGLIGYQYNNSLVNNCYINASITSLNNIYVGGIIGTSNEDSISNCVFYGNVNNENILYGEVSNVNNYKNLYYYTYNSEFINIYSYITKEKTNMSLNSLANILTTNINDEFSWKVDKEYLRFDNESNVNLYINSSDYIPSNFKENETGIKNNIVYINDLKKDFNYYMGLNYTSNDGHLPTLENKNIYDKNNLVNLQITYYGLDYNKEFHGYVSLTEMQDTFVYYKMLPVNNNSTVDLSDDYVEIELIDNPFTNRPHKMAFNGWTTNFPNAYISFNSDIYVRTVKIPVKYVNNMPKDLTINLYASWVSATVTNINSSSNWQNAFKELKEKNMEKIESAYTIIYAPYDMTGYFRQVIISRWQSYAGYYNSNGQLMQNGMCWSSTCTYYDRIENGNYVEGETYYYLNNNSMRVLDPDTLDIEILDRVPTFTTSGSVSGFFEQVRLSNGQSLIGYYDSTGNLMTSGTCSGNCTYYSLIQFYDNNGNPNRYNENKDYYYLVTRDTNIIVLTGDISNTWSSSQNKPFTLTSIYNSNDYTDAIWNVSSAAVNCYADTVIENIKIYSGQTKVTGETNPPSGSSSRNFYGRWFNVKLGRGIIQNGTNYTNFNHILGGYSESTGSNQNTTKYRFIVESGVYNTISLTGGATSNYNQYLEMTAIYGNDYDKAINDNNKLNVVFCASGQWGSNIYSLNESAIGTDLTVKSGSFGTNKYNYTTGIYVGGRYNGSANMARKIKFEGGYTYNLIGGPLTSSSRADYNDSYIYVTGGEIDILIGGAGTSATYGNRIIQMTGGLINYSLFGGSNGYQGTGDDGTLKGSSFIYVGGDATIGNPTYVSNNNTLFGAEAGSVFGIGNGRAGSQYTAIGSNDNASIIIDGDSIINRNIYGGGNFGATGISSNYTTSTTSINILGGNVKGNIYGGGNNNGSGSSSIESQINIKMFDGNIEGSIYGGSNQLGVIYGNVDLLIYGGKVNGSIYGGGRGGYTNSNNQGTFVSENINVIVGNRNYNTIPTISGNVYGGSAYGTVNSLSNSSTVSSYNTTVTINEGIINTVYGGGEGDTSYTPYVSGSVFVNINGGEIVSVYGGHDVYGITNATTTLNLNGGKINYVYGGGRKANLSSSIINLSGSDIDNIYGGGYESSINTSNINIISGNAINIYGGSNISGDTLESNIKNIKKTYINPLEVSISSTTKDVESWENVDYLGYADLKVVITNNTDQIIDKWEVEFSTVNSDISYNYSSVEVIKNGNTYKFDQVNKWHGVNSIDAKNSFSFDFGLGLYVSKEQFEIINIKVTGLDENGNIEIEEEKQLSIKNIYGGNNLGGSTLNCNITLDSIVVDNIYGGGYSALTNENVLINLKNTIINETIYGGGNNGDISGNIDLTIKSSSIKNLYGGGNNGDVSGNIDLTIDDSIIENLYGGGNNGVVLGDINLTISNTETKNSLFSGGNNGLVNGNTNLIINNVTVGESIYGGGNFSSVYGETYLLISGNSNIKKSVFGGGNIGSVGTEENNSKTTVDILGGTILKNVYGGGNTSIVYGSTEVNIGMSKLDYPQNKIDIKGTVFGGGEANDEGSEIYDYSFISVTNGILVNIDGQEYEDDELIIAGSVFGSGNASSSKGNSYIYINSLGSLYKPNKMISIQRANTVTISNSFVEFIGTTDRTNEYSSIKYSINRVDLLKIKNGTTLLLQRNANLLKRLESLVDINGVEEKASVSIGDNVSKNVDNRIYILANRNLNITTNESATSYGEIKGMTFLGMYLTYEDRYIYGIYNMEDNSSADASDIITGGTYTLGLHAYDMNYKIDGFYSNFINDEYTMVNTDYIIPTPPNSNYYIWSIGIDAINYSFSLTSSKYSSLGTYELSLIDFSAGNTYFEVLGFNSEGLSNGVSMVDPNEVPKIARTQEEANKIIGLSMKSETTEWTSLNSTNFLSNGNGTYKGDSTYLTDNQTTAPSLTFYLYHPKNITNDGIIGTVIITLHALVPKNEVDYDISLIVITIDINSKTYDDGEAYDASITYGKKYEMPSINDVNITSDSQFTAYYSLYAEKDKLSDIYGINGNYYHTLSSNYVLPIGTEITMIDLAADLQNPTYYYYKVDELNYDEKLNQYNNDNEATYDLKDFIYMNSINSNNNYDDIKMNQLYYHEDTKIVVEEFLFIFDFKNTNISGNKLNNSIIFELRTNEDRTSISVLGIRQDIMKYSLYNKSNIVLKSKLNIDSENIYYNINKNLLYSINVGYDQTSNRESIIDTNYENSNMGINITFLDNSNNIMSSSVLVGTSITIDNNEYYASSDGIFRIKLSNKVSNLDKNINLIIGKTLSSGKYKLKLELFASSDGLHITNNVDSTDYINLNLIGSNNSIDAIIDDNSKIIDGETGKTLSSNDFILYKFNYESVLENPNIRVSVYKRDNKSYDSNEYELIDLRSLTSTNLVYPSAYSLKSTENYEYMVSNNPESDTLLRLRLLPTLESGTYKFVFKLCDSNVIIDEDYEYIIIKKNIVE